MPIDLRARVVSAPRDPGYSDSVLARQANYYGDSRSHRGADPTWLARSAREYESLGYDSALIAQRSGWPDVWSLAGWSLAATTRFSIAAAHRVGLQAPTAAARSLASLHQLSGGRISAHIILGASDDDQKRDGDFLSKSDRYLRAAEYLQVVRQWLSSTEPFDFSGEFYQVRGALAGHRPDPGPLLSYGGSSPESLDLAGRYADIYAVTAEPLAGTSELIGKVRAIAAEHGRAPSFWYSTPNVILGRTDDDARHKADALTEELLIARDYQEARKIGLAHGINAKPESVNRARWLAAVNEADWHDKALYTGIGRITGYGWPAYVGSPETVADALLDYYDLGVRIFGIGLSTDADEDRELATELFRLLRLGAAQRDADHEQGHSHELITTH
jgi:alkanesulfonate monooxygenase